jgi:hypothetical protein
MSLVTGNQLKAARALAGVDQQQVADAAEINVNTVRNMEARGAEPITSSAVTIRSVQLALEAWGIEFLNHGQPGVRLRKVPAESPFGSKPAPTGKPSRPKKPRQRGS